MITLVILIFSNLGWAFYAFLLLFSLQHGLKMQQVPPSRPQDPRWYCQTIVVRLVSSASSYQIKPGWGKTPRQAGQAVVKAWLGQKPHQVSLKLIWHVSECHVPQYGTSGLAQHWHSTAHMRESPVSDHVGGNGSQRLNPGLHNKCPSLPAFQVLKLPSHPRGDFNSRKGWEWSQFDATAAGTDSIKTQ